jgi:hypothetical protein
MRDRLFYALNRIATQKPAAEYTRVRAAAPGYVQIVTKYQGVSDEYAEWTGTEREFRQLFLSYIVRSLYWRMNWLSTD